MNAPKMVVKCNVDTCKYYENSLCHADSIEVNPMGDKAYSSDNTCCTTFVSEE